MAYVTQSDMQAVVPDAVLLSGLDDEHAGEGEGSAAVWDVIASAAARRIDGILGARYTVPFADPAPALVREAAVIFAAHMLYLRRGVNREGNPWADEAAAMMTRLRDVADGKADLEAGDDDAAPAAITEPSGTYNASGRLML